MNVVMLDEEDDEVVGPAEGRSTPITSAQVVSAITSLSFTPRPRARDAFANRSGPIRSSPAPPPRRDVTE